MRKLAIFLTIMLMLQSNGCAKKESPKTDENKQQVKSIDVKAAKQFMDNYMRYVMKMNTGAMKSFYSEKMKQNLHDVQTPLEPHPVGFKIEEGEGKSDKAEFKAHIYNTITAKTYYSDDTFKYTVIMESGKMVIDKIEKEKVIEVYEKNKNLYKREGDKAQGEPLISVDYMPQFAVPKGASSPEQKFAVPRDKFGPCAISPDGKNIAVTSMGVHTFLGIVSAEESKQTMTTKEGSEGKAGGKSGSDQGSIQSSGEGSKGSQQETANNITIKPVDLFFEGSINIISFSPDGKMLVAEYIPATGIGRINIYKSDSAELIDLKESMDRFKADRFSITSPFFVSEGNIIFTVIPIKEATNEEQMLKGDWMLEIKNQKLTQIKY